MSQGVYSETGSRRTLSKVRNLKLKDEERRDNVEPVLNKLESVVTEAVNVDILGKGASDSQHIAAFIQSLKKKNEEKPKKQEIERPYQVK